MTSFHKRASAWTGSGHRSIAPSSSSPSAQRTQRARAGEPNPGSRSRPGGHGPHTALAPRWLIASALARVQLLDRRTPGGRTSAYLVPRLSKATRTSLARYQTRAGGGRKEQWYGFCVQAEVEER